ncbi:hypothetical protein KFE98_18440 [bacterium SCSIO 12741]|nr:hypothetical protein KFE98_18440 [bacterium SCSIO 12741]
MKFKKVIVSLFLLLTYSMGFAHYLVPHSHEEAGEHTHHHHLDLDNHNEDEFHVHHDDHVDASLYDWLVCLVTDMEHPEDDCSNEPSELTSPLTLTQKVQKKIELISTLYVILELPVAECEEPVNTAYFTPEYQVPPLLRSFLRGPPSVLA